jgi:hypothetical protein
LIEFVTDGNQYTVTSRALFYFFGSVLQTRFFFETAQRIYDSRTGTVIADFINVVKINSRPDTNIPLPGDIRMAIVGQPVASDGFVDDYQVLVSYQDTDNDGVADDPDFFDEIVAPDVNPTSIYYLNPTKAVAICLRTNVGTYSNANLGFDSLLGTYYTFSNCPQLVRRTDTTITGFDQMQKTLVTNTASYYSAIAYTIPSYANSNWNNLPAILANLPALSNALPTAIPATIQNITGSAIPYPYANTAFTSNTFYDGQESPNKYGMVLSTSNGNSNRNYGPSIIYDESALQYEQSISWVNSHLHYTSRLDIIYDSNAFHEWSGLPLIPNSIHASVPNHMLFNGGSIAITKYTTYNFLVPNAPPLRTFSNAQAFTADLVFPYKEQTNLLAISGNNREYCFLGATATADPTKSQLRFKVYNPITRVLTALPTNPNYTFSNSLLLQGFVFHNTRQWYLSASSPVNNVVVFQGDTTYQSSSNTMIQDVYPNSAHSELQMDPSGAYVYLGTWSAQQTGFTTMRLFSLNSNAGYAYVRSNGYVIGLGTGDLSEANPLPESYTKMCVNTTIQGEQVLFTSFEQRPSYFYKLITYQPGSVNTDSNAEIVQSPFRISDRNGDAVSPSRLVPGAGGSLWLHFESSQMLRQYGAIQLCVLPGPWNLFRSRRVVEVGMTVDDFQSFRTIICGNIPRSKSRHADRRRCDK